MHVNMFYQDVKKAKEYLYFFIQTVFSKKCNQVYSESCSLIIIA